MISITIEINGFHQLLQAEKHLVDDITAEIEGLFIDSGFQKIGTRNNTIRYDGLEEEISLSRIVDILFYLHNFIAEKREELPGMTVLVQKSSGLLKKGMGRSYDTNELYLLPEEDGVWCSREALELINHFVTCEEGEGYCRITDFTRNSISSASLPELFHPGDILDSLLDQIFRMHEGRDVRIPVLIGPEGSGKRLILQNMLRMIDTKDEDRQWLQLNPYKETGSTYISLLCSAVSTAAAQPPLCINRYEKEAWDDVEKLFSLPFRSWSESDALLCFVNYLQGYRRRMVSELLPPVFIVHAFDMLDEKVRELILKVIGDVREENQLLTILTMREENQGLLESGNIHTIEFPVADWIEQLASKKGTPLLSPYQLYIPDKPSVQGSKGDSETAAILTVLQDSMEQVQKVYYCCAILDGLLDKADILKVFARCGIGREEAEQCLCQLVNVGLLMNSERFYLTFKGRVDRVFKGLKLDYQRLDRIIEEEMLDNAEKLEFYKTIETAAKIGFSREGWLRIQRLLAEHILADMEVPLLPQVKKAFRLLNGRFPSIEYTIFLLASMWDGDMEEAEKYYRELFPAEPGSQDPPQSGWPGILRTYVEGEYLWRKRAESGRVLKKVKQALLQVQEEIFPELESRAIILLGKVMLTNNRMTEASEYFRQGRQKTFDTSLNSAACESIALTALSYFLTGDYSLSYSHAMASEQKARKTGRRKWERYAKMLMVRIQFELGRYGESHQLLQELLTHDRLFFEGQGHDYFMAWLARASLYQGYVDTAEKILVDLPETAETLYFLTEVHLLNRDLETANSYASAALARLDKEDHDILPIAQLPIDGFEPYENLALKIPGVYNMVRQVLYAISGFCLHEIERFEEAEESFGKLFDQEKITRQDPYRHLYYYFRTVTLPSTADKEELNMLTYLSKAFQSLQKIAGRISDPTDRRSYTNQNYWNSKLYNLSRHYKLV